MSPYRPLAEQHGARRVVVGHPALPDARADIEGPDHGGRGQIAKIVQQDAQRRDSAR
jgi:hypothetical protein